MVPPDFYSDGVPTNETADKDRTTTYTFDSKGRQAVVTAKAQSSNNDQKTYYFFCDTDDDTNNNNLVSGSMVTAVAYPDSTDTVTDNSSTTGLWNLGSGTDRVSYTYDRLGRKLTATDQRQVVHTYAFSTTTGALDSDTVTFPQSPPASLDDTIKRIGYHRDDFGRTDKVTSYSDTGGSTVANEVAFEYGPWGAVTKSTQNHATGTASGDPNVQYAYEDGIAGNEAKYVRQASVTYPGPSARRAVYYNYPTSGVGAALGRLGNIAPSSGSHYADYTYLGAGTVVKVAYPAVTGGLALTYAGAASGDYSGFDPTSRLSRYARASRFGRVVWQRWLRTDGSAADRYFYPPRRTPGNRKWRAERADLSNAGGRDEAYVYDGLDRLIGAKRGILPSGTYQAPYPGDVDLNGFVNFTDYSIQDDNWEQSGKTWTQGDLNGDGTVDYEDCLILDDNWEADPNETVARQWSWTLDPVGNWSGFKSSGATTQPWDLDQARLHNKANEIEDTVNQTPNAISGTPDWVNPAYDLAGNMTAGPQPRYETVDANTQLHKYDAWNRLTKIYRDANCNDTIDDPSELVATYSYDGQNRRIRKVVEAGESDITYDYYYNENWQVLEVRKGGSANSYEQYVWGVQYVDAPVVRFQDSDTNGTLNNTLYYTYDAQFNVTALIEPDGDVVERYVYDPYGKVTFKAADWSDAASQAKSAYDNDILYCGYRFDPESGLYHVRNRYLTPPLGRWLTPDPIEYGDGMNWYQFAHCSPAQYLDPDGYSAVSVTELEVWFTEVTPGAAGQAHWAFKVNAAACECECNHRWYIPQYDLEIVLFVTLNPGKNDPPDRIGQYSRQGVYGHEMRHIRMMERALYQRESELVKLLQDEELKGRGRFVSEEQCDVVRKRNQELIDKIRVKMRHIQVDGTSEVEPGFRDVATDKEAEKTGHPRASTVYDRYNDNTVNYSAITPDKYDPDKWSVSFGKPVPVKAPEWTLSESYDKNRKDKF